MAEFLTTDGLSHHILQIIKESRNKLAIISPYLQLSIKNFNQLKEASDRNIKIKLVFGKNKLKRNDRNYLKQIKNVELFYLKDLHSKCYINETSLIITSMNLIEYSQKYNREMGILFDRIKDEVIFNKAIEEIQSILAVSKKVDLFNLDNSIVYENPRQNQSVIQKLDFEKDLYRNLKDGFCIKCGIKIEYNRDEPYCKSCYSSWLKLQDRSISEERCHCCGTYNNSTINRPECSSCFNRMQLINVP